MAAWPRGARGALSLSFDNLGEAAEIELGALAADTPLGGHFTATRVLPTLLDALLGRDFAATFFIEGLNAELYPDALQKIAASGHEVAYHAWRHEQWGQLPAAEQAANLRRGVAAFRALDLAPAGMRPPGGALGPGGVAVLHEAGLRYCSPAGTGASAEGGVVLLPFQWRHVDASCVLPPLAAARQQMTGSPDPLDPGAFLAYLEAEIERLVREGGFATVVLHLFMLDWLGEKRLAKLLDAIATQQDLWVAPCAEIAKQVLAHPKAFAEKTTLDSTSWSGG
ncbi:MAG TPA: polysaccharide deacetylase family protein [Solirubrobacterales bacterium]|nr:polysaccharide deacetylase family protein [Solirubrobacterales bacterium]